MRSVTDIADHLKPDHNSSLASQLSKTSIKMNYSSNAAALGCLTGCKSDETDELSAVDKLKGKHPSK